MVVLVQLRGQVVLQQIRARTAASVGKQRQRLGQVVEEGAWAHQIRPTLLQSDVSVVLGGSTGEDNWRRFHTAAAAGQLVEEFVRQRCRLQLLRLLNSFSTATSTEEFVHQQYLCLLLALLGLHVPLKG